MPGVPRATYLPHPFQIVQSDTDLMMLYQFAGAVRTIKMGQHTEAPVDSWMCTSVTTVVISTRRDVCCVPRIPLR